MSRRDASAVRVMVVGTSGAGKTTFARRLAAEVGAPHIELDAINWQAGWRDLDTHDPPEFSRRVAEAAADEAWVSDGNYRRVQDLLLSRATDLVWLDFSRAVIMRRVLWRSLARAITGEELWPSTGNREDFRRWLDKEHPIRWAWDTFAERRRRHTALFADPALANLRKHRLRSPRDAERLVNVMSRSDLVRRPDRESAGRGPAGSGPRGGGR